MSRRPWVVGDLVARHPAHSAAAARSDSEPRPQDATAPAGRVIRPEQVQAALADLVQTLHRIRANVNLRLALDVLLLRRSRRPDVHVALRDRRLRRRLLNQE